MIQPPKMSPAGLVSAGIATVRSDNSPRGPTLLFGILASFCYGPVIMTEILVRHDRDGIATLTLNRPAARNALSMGLMESLDGELAGIAEDRSIKVVIIAANGPAFCAGHDLREIRATPNRAAYDQVFALCSRLMQRIVRLPKPVIAQVHGVATAAGCQLVASADLAVAADTARFATPGVDIGLFCSTPMVALSRAVGRKAAMEMLLTGEAVSALRARELGLVNRVVPEAELHDATRALAAQIAAKSPLSVAIGKEAFYRQAEMDLSRAYNYASEVMTRNMLARDAEEGIDAFLAKRQPQWTGT
jgi:enoyl-CoA hydratase/carnithine racemase